MKLAYHASLSRRRSPVRIRSGPPELKNYPCGSYFNSDGLNSLNKAIVRAQRVIAGSAKRREVKTCLHVFTNKRRRLTDIRSGPPYCLYLKLLILERFFDTLEPMKEIYFACSIRSGRDDTVTYAAMVEYIKTRAVVLSEIFADAKLTTAGSSGPSADIHAKDLKWVRQADALIAEVTNPSLGVGYEIAKAEMWGKPVLALFRDDGSRRLSAMIDGSPDTQTVYYREIDEAFVAIGAFMATLPEK